MAIFTRPIAGERPFIESRPGVDFYLACKTLHLIFVVTWFSGLFYLPRLFVYFVEAQERPPQERQVLQEQFKIMQKRLWYGITWPSCLLAIAFGMGMFLQWNPAELYGWPLAKLGLVSLLFLYHLSLGAINRQLQRGAILWTPQQLRLWNEVPVLFLVSIVALVVFKRVFSLGYSLLGLACVALALLAAVKIYKRFRDV